MKEQPQGPGSTVSGNEDCICGHPKHGGPSCDLQMDEEGFTIGPLCPCTEYRPNVLPDLKAIQERAEDIVADHRRVEAIPEAYCSECGRLWPCEARSLAEDTLMLLKALAEAQSDAAALVIGLAAIEAGGCEKCRPAAAEVLNDTERAVKVAKLIEQYHRERNEAEGKLKALEPYIKHHNYRCAPPRSCECGLDAILGGSI